ncbi:LysR family transcriptional regulator [Sphingomonas sp. TREG-RG-20F-R18-01]|uniref:LysR family transcriptional regulator n=1 Tax=Sphingomonas sp. TREG-RG-20F-R18-01 TaxID=2914982 RepID=UPI001F5AB8F4|nr:LysR family transcriptional regulator [Sphingomonas sp. TREG-RG-20F-R18-01]
MDKERFDISLEDLQTFLAVADQGSFSRAAERLALSQPSISNRVKRLEEKLNVRLLERTTRKVELTQHGRRLHERASITLRALRDLLQEFHAETGMRRRQVEVAATMMIASVALAPILGSFAEAHPDISVRLRDRIPDAAVAEVLDGECDMAVMVLERSNPALAFEPLLADRCVAVTPLGHPLLQKGSATFAEVLRYSILSPDGHVALRRAIEEAAAARGLDITLSAPARGVTNVMTLLAMAAAGLGVCIHPSTLIPAEFRPTIGLVEIEDCEILRTIGIVTATGRNLSGPAMRFREHLRRAVHMAYPDAPEVRRMQTQPSSPAG